jgi:phosphoadenosine phosphosulfate reductase
VTFDTDRLFPATYDVWTRTEDHYGKRVAMLLPEREHVEALVARQGVNGFRAFVKARQACCGVRKFELLGTHSPQARRNISGAGHAQGI